MNTEPVQPKRGGRRPGAGRKKGPPAGRVQLTIYVTPEALAKLGANAALRIRELVENMA